MNKITEAQLLIKGRCAIKFSSSNKMKKLNSVIELSQTRLLISWQNDGPRGRAVLRTGEGRKRRLLGKPRASSTGGECRELSGASFIRALTPFMRAPPSLPNHLPKTTPPNTVTFQGQDVIREL